MFILYGTKMMHAAYRYKAEVKKEQKKKRTKTKKQKTLVFS